MATREVAGRRYALAVMEIARAGGSLDHWRDSLDGLEALTSRPEFVAALQSDGMTDERFQAIAREAVPDVTEMELKLFRLLRRKGRLALGPSIASYYRELWDEQRGVVRAVARSAVALDGAQRDAIAQRIAEQTGKQVELELEVDPSLIGGAVIRIGDQLIDGSTRRRLRDLHQQLQRAGA